MKQFTITEIFEITDKHFNEAKEREDTAQCLIIVAIKSDLLSIVKNEK